MTARTLPDGQCVRHGRDAGVEVFRFVMAMLVILLHILPDATWSSSDPWGSPRWVVIADALCRCAVPFFFLISGYYFRAERGAVENSRRAIVRLLPIYVFWSVCYLVAAYVASGGRLGPWRWLRLLEGGGPAFHLWFLPALLFALITLSVSLALGGRRLAILVAATFALGGPILSDYHALLGIDSYPSHLNDIRRQLAAPAFVVIGYLLKTMPPIAIRTSLTLCAIAFAGLLAERTILILSVGNPALVNSDGLLGTFCFGTAVFLLARSLNDAHWVRPFARLGRISLAVFLCHLFLLWIVLAVIPPIPGRTLVCFVLIATGAIATALVLVRIPRLRRFTT
jgi:surface polysaccharide O-acyltransferase-like enzyme